MNKQVLSPFDCDMCAMIEDITKQEIEVTASDASIRLSWAQNGSEGNDKAEGQRIEALKQAIRGRLGDRLIEFFYADGRQSVFMKYDPEEYPEEMRTRLVDPDATAGTRYCRTLLEVDAIQFSPGQCGRRVEVYRRGNRCNAPHTGRQSNIFFSQWQRHIR